MTMIIIGIVILIIAVALFMFATNLLYKGEEIGALFVLFALAIFAGGIVSIIIGTQQNTSETVLQHLTTKQIVEIKINKDNKPYYALKDSSYTELYNYLILINK